MFPSQAGFHEPLEESEQGALVHTAAAETPCFLNEGFRRAMAPALHHTWTPAVPRAHTNQLGQGLLTEIYRSTHMSSRAHWAELPALSISTLISMQTPLQPLCSFAEGTNVFPIFLLNSQSCGCSLTSLAAAAVLLPVGGN